MCGERYHLQCRSSFLDYSFNFSSAWKCTSDVYSVCVMWALAFGGYILEHIAKSGAADDVLGVRAEFFA